MTDLPTAKKTALAFQASLDTAEEASLAEVLARHTFPDYLWRGIHPFNEMTGAEAVAERFWRPLRHAFRPLQRRVDIFLAGYNEIDDFASAWTISMGHLVGLFDEPWLGIPPTGKMAFLRWCEFHRIEGERIAETHLHIDIPHLMLQAGLRPFPPQSAAHLVQPGPMTHDGLLYGEHPPEEGAATLALINAMCADIGNWQSGLPLEEELARTWHADMIWWGPAGIGATHTIPRYARQHAAPFRAAFTERAATNHLCRFAEGCYGGFFGWPNFTVIHGGGFQGMPPMPPESRVHGEFRVIDIYRRAGERLAENWVFIDLLHFWKTQNNDILARMPELIAHREKLP